MVHSELYSVLLNGSYPQDYAIRIVKVHGDIYDMDGRNETKIDSICVEIPSRLKSGHMHARNFVEGNYTYALLCTCRT